MSLTNHPLVPESSKERIREQVHSGVESVKTQVAATGRTIRDETLATGHVIREEAAAVANEKLEQAKQGTADTLDRAARGLEDRANDTTSPRYRRAATEMSHRLKDASEYVRTKSYSDAVDDVRADMSAHPGRWIAAALSIGFVGGICFQGLANRRRRG